MSSLTGQVAVSARQTEKMVRRFNRFLQLDDVLLDRYGQAAAATMRDEMLAEFRQLVPKVPYIGGRRSPLSRQLVQSAMALAVYQVVREREGSLQDTGELLHHLYRAQAEQFPRKLRPLLRWYMFSGLRRRQALREAQRSQEHRYPGDWVFERVDGDGMNFDQGRDYTE